MFLWVDKKSLVSFRLSKLQFTGVTGEFNVYPRAIKLANFTRQNFLLNLEHACALLEMERNGLG